MLVSVKWLREMVPFEVGVEELADRLTMLGLEMEEFTRPFEEIEDVVVGHVLTCEKHPEADKLSVCTVDVGGGEPLNIVCGAPNVAAGQKVAVAKVGTTLPGGLKLKKAKIRGVASQGMICAEDELGLGEDHSGIMVLSEDLEIGAKLVDALNLDDLVLDIGVTPNRADCLSILGVAREVAMAYGLPVTLPPLDIAAFEDDSLAPVSKIMDIEVADPDLCPAYRGRVIEGVSVGKSPAWLRYRLLAHGMRPISNMVDITNYILLETGQPLHAFDLALLEGGKIRVAPAEDGMEFTTLDDQTRKLTGDDLLIWDGNRPVALAGVMGGANTEVNAGTSRVFLESAVFKPISVRRTARRLGIPSEASYRFERGVDQPGSRIAMDRAAALMARLGGGRVAPGSTEAEPAPWENRVINFRAQRARELLGMDDLADDFCHRVLVNMGCETREQAPGVWQVVAPSHRLDLEREVDLVEEVGRVFGMDRIPLVRPHMAKSLESPTLADTEFGFIAKLKDWGRGVGLNEVINYSFFGQKDLDRLGLPKEDRVPVANPLTEEQDVLRTALAPGLLYSMKVNLAQGQERLRLFEHARIFHHDASSETSAREAGRLGILLHGPREREGWPHNREAVDYLDVKGLVEHLLESLGQPEAGFSMAPADYVPQSYCSPCVLVTLADEELGFVGRVKPDVADEYHARTAVWIAELDADLLRAKYSASIPVWKELPKFPPVKRDITLTVPAGISAGRVLDAFRSQNSRIMVSVMLQDLFEPTETGSGEGARNLTFRLTFRHPDKTLKDKDVDKEMERMAQAVMKELPVSR
ncbi:phenylalanine--tRNA ligase subunit beta [Oceanidesulfovibrio indonesiensis]|uniref:Phenylalanine--tRNA ligase beta subunit n=1 Tax=Oceanidesulfovibrio indonesiensis TaxID=54767 RepID=A0A7M3MF06_9BACT|nr:phenylalanine--tRNA ligase subunit beta [Oceanidesulfovibrio indonesiensis]TVM17599.1 phenylalanine--tRNA ligase subunit beta [Oceanidesulfovibrio indonesiensis]